MNYRCVYILNSTLFAKQYCFTNYPVHGGWSVWNGWGDCDSSCGVGLQHRDRLCNSPRPSFGGDHCFGDNSAYRICIDMQCNGKVAQTCASKTPFKKSKELVYYYLSLIFVQQIYQTSTVNHVLCANIRCDLYYRCRMHNYCFLVCTAKHFTV